MESGIDRLFLDCSVRRLEQTSARIESCLALLSDEQVWARGGDNENAVGNLVLHLCGNVRQWIVAAVGGRSDTRRRDAEFDARGGMPVAGLSASLRATVAEAAAVIGSVAADRLPERLVIQGYEVSVLEAIYHVVEHFSGHAGQIIFATKMLTGGDLGFYRHLRGAGAAQGEKTP